MHVKAEIGVKSVHYLKNGTESGEISKIMGYGRIIRLCISNYDISYSMKKVLWSVSRSTSKYLLQHI